MKKHKQWEEDEGFSSGKPVEKDYYTKYRHKIYDYDEEEYDDEYGDEYYDYGDDE